MTNHITTTIRLELTGVSPEHDKLLHECLMRPQQSALRYAYNRLVDGADEKSLWQAMREKFQLLTGRSTNDAITSAKGLLSSQRERLPEQMQGLCARIAQSEARLERELGRGADPRAERVQAMQRRIRRLSAQRETLQYCLDSGSVPPVVFGGRALWSKVQRGLPGAREEWREARTNQFVSRGARNCKGNPHCRLIVDENGSLCLAVRVPTSIIERRGRVTTRARWLVFDVCYSWQYERLLRQVAIDGAAGIAKYTVRLIRLLPGQYRAQVTVDEPVAHREYSTWESMPDWCAKLGGVDLNLDHLAVVAIDRHGQFGANRTFQYANLGELPRNKSKWQIGNIVRDVVQWLRAQGVQGLVIEELNITRRRGGSARFHRRTVPFAYRQLTQALARRALREGMVVKRVHPAYTSWIGQLKYAGQYGTSTHIAAAYVIARRGLGLQERIPKQLVEKFPALAQILHGEITKLEQRLVGQEGDDGSQKLIRLLEKRQEWARRLVDWKLCSPEAGRPWLLWVTLYLVNKNVSGARDVLFEGNTCGRN